jgi:ribosomal protein L22
MKRKKNLPSSQPKLQRGALSKDSIFENLEQELAAEEEQKEEEPSKQKITKAPRLKIGRFTRNAQVMNTVLDPDPKNRLRWERKMVIRQITKRGRLTKAQYIKRTEREYLAKGKKWRTSVKKLGMLARQIAGKPIEEAILQMRFSKKRAAIDVRRHLQRARIQAIVRRGMGLGAAEGRKGEPVEVELKDGSRKLVKDRTGIYVDQAWVGRGAYGKSVEFRARGRVNVLHHPKTSKQSLHDGFLLSG